MAYIKNTWIDREGTTRYFETIGNDGAKIFTPDYSEVTEIGTPVNADNMNHIEEGIAGCDLRKYDTTETYEKGEWVTGVVDNVKGIYESLANNNVGNLLTDEKSWKAINLEIPPATSSQYGTVKVDNSSIKINDNGQIYSDSIIQKVLNANSRAGYVIFKSGFMMQWGIASTNGASGTAGVANVSLYIPMYCWQIQATVSGTGVGAFTIQVIPTSATGFQVITSSGGVWTNGIEFHWLAIGVKA